MFLLVRCNVNKYLLFSNAICIYHNNKISQIVCFVFIQEYKVFITNITVYVSTTSFSRGPQSALTLSHKIRGVWKVGIRWSLNQPKPNVFLRIVCFLFTALLAAYRLTTRTKYNEFPKRREHKIELIGKITINAIASFFIDAIFLV